MSDRDKLSKLRKARCECGYEFPVAVAPGEYRYPDVVCPKCGRKFLIKRIEDTIGLGR